MSIASTDVLSQLVSRDESAILQAWIKEQTASTTLRKDLIPAGTLEQQSGEFLGLFSRALKSGVENVQTAPWTAVRDFLAGLSRVRAQQGFTPLETATFVFSLKQVLFQRLLAEIRDADVLGRELWQTTQLLDQLGLYTTEQFQRGRDDVIRRQQHEILELSTPVVKLWEGVVAVPLIGTLDSARTQVVMESLLEKIVETGASIAIIDITGVPTVDTLVAQHLIKTVAAARLMGADCIISGIRPQIAQTIVHLGIELEDVTTKATLADALALSFARLGQTIGRA